jgi:hypothetical protein
MLGKLGSLDVLIKEQRSTNDSLPVGDPKKLVDCEDDITSQRRENEVVNTIYKISYNKEEEEEEEEEEEGKAVIIVAAE